MSEPSPSEIVRQILRAWEDAKLQLSDLRTQVERATRMADLKLKSSFLGKDRDRVFKELGEAVWSQVQKGKLVLPPALAPAVKAIEQLEQRASSAKMEIEDVLREGEEAADRLKRGPKSPVAAKQKKR